MPMPQTNFSPAFNTTRASHVVLTTRDLPLARDFYTEVIGLVVTDETPFEIHLRGLEESGHHSLVLRKTEEAPVCERIGFRVFQDEDLDRAKAYFDRQGIAARWAERPYQSRTLEVNDPSGIPLEFCFGMPTQPRLHDKPHLHRGAAALRYDHVQCLVPDVAATGRFYTEIGFRISDYFVDKEADEEPQGLFLYRKNNPHDIVFLMRPGPQLHHFAFIVADVQSLFRALDTAGGIGFSRNLERGPGRHGQGHAFYVYFRDPDGHRVEILPPPIQIVDFEDGPVRWHSGNRFTWDLPPPRKWLHEATSFAGAPLTAPALEPNLFSLEDYLARR
jgi:catechol 2,3-dioxygenase